MVEKDGWLTFKGMFGLHNYDFVHLHNVTITSKPIESVRIHAGQSLTFTSESPTFTSDHEKISVGFEVCYTNRSGNSVHYIICFIIESG